MRDLGPADLGLDASVELTATLEVADGAAIVRIAWIRGRIQRPFALRARLCVLAREAGAARLRVEARIANERLLALLLSRYGLDTQAGVDVMEVSVQ